VEGISSAARPLIEAALPLLLTPDKVESTRRALSSCLDALPRDGAVGYLSVMLARQPVTAKLYLIMPRASVRDFLVRAAWPGDIRAAEDLLDHFYAPAIRTAYVDVTVTDRVESRSGFALSQFHRRELRHGPEESCLRKLPAAINREAAELERWPGASRSPIDGAEARLTRWLDFKAVLQGDQIRYKAYLGFMRHLRPI
jgi:hypothetical protein